MNTYDTLVEATNDLQKRGFEHNFNLESDRLYCEKLEKYYHPKEFTIKEVHRFEGMTNPSDNSVVYALETNNGDKGMLVDAYGTYADSLSEEMLSKLKAGYQQ